MQLSLFEEAVLRGIAQTGSTKGTYNAFSEAIGLSSSDMRETVKRGKDGLRLKWQHKIRSIQSILKSKGLIQNGSQRGAWSLTEKGRGRLNFAPKNQVKAYFQTENGLSFWGDSTSVIPELFPNEVSLIVTSPPYLGHSREYGKTTDVKEYVENLALMIESWLPMLKRDGSLVLNLGEVTQEGCQSSYKHRLLILLEDRLGLKIVQNFYWVSPTKPPSGTWTTKRKRNVVTVTEELFWLSLNPKEVKANNQNVLVEYSETQKKYIQSATRKSPTSRKKPSGHSANDETFYKDNGGAIPSNVLYAVPEGANSAYSKYCKENGLPRHPAMFPEEIPSFFIDFLTERGDVIFDPCSGSGVAPLSAEKSNRHWISGELAEEYVKGHIGRMEVNGFSCQRLAL